MPGMQILPKLLLIEDNQYIIKTLKEVLRSSYEVEVALTGKRGIYQVDATSYDVIVLDLTLPDVAGLGVCQLLRERGHTTPILVLTAETSIRTKIELLDAGANDYMTKPFSLGELKARLRVLTRQRAHDPSLSQHYVVRDLSLNTATREVSRQGISITLRRKEFALLECLMSRPGHVVSREELIRHAWQGSDAPWTNTIDVHIKYLRDKVDRPFSTPMISTIHGYGYRLSSEQRPRPSDDAKTSVENNTTTPVLQTLQPTC